jgi:hypothetical protein
MMRKIGKHLWAGVRSIDFAAVFASFLILSGAAVIVYGICIVAGAGWAAIAGGVLAIAFGFVLLRGMAINA